jgi:hypothetical protein
MGGTVTTNNATKDFLTFDEAAYRMDPPHVPACESSVALGEPVVSTGGLPWSQELTTKGAGKLSGSKKIVISLTFPEAKCVMEGTKGKDTFPLVEETAIPLELSLPALALKASKASSKLCPRTGVLEEIAIAVSDQAQTKDHVEVKPKRRKSK